MKSLANKVWNWIKSVVNYFFHNFKEIFTTVLEICAVGVIAYGVNVNWGKGWGLIVGGVFALVMSFLSSIKSNPERGNQ